MKDSFSCKNVNTHDRTNTENAVNATMDSSHHVTVPLRYGIKKMRKRRDLDALLAQNQQKIQAQRRCNGNQLQQHLQQHQRHLYSQDKLLNAISTDDQEDYVWQPKVKQSSHHCGHSRYTIIKLYIILLFIVVLMIFVGFTYWLNFNLQQQMYDYRQKVEQVSATSQLLPDTLQVWHETSTSLMKNQTVIYTKLLELQHSLQDLWQNFTDYRTTMMAKKTYEKEEKLVADFGAKIEAIATDVDSLKDHYNGLNEKQDILQKTFDNLRSNFSDGLNNMAQPLNYTNELKLLRTDVYNKLDKLEINVSYINDTLTQKSIMMQEELVKHKNNLDELFDRSANITSHVTSLENSWPDYKDKVLNFSRVLPRLEKEITKLLSNSKHVESALENVCQECRNFYIENLQQPQQQSNHIDHENGQEYKMQMRKVKSTIMPLRATKATTTTTTTPTTTTAPSVTAL